MTKQELNKKLLAFAERIMYPTSFFQGEEVCPCQDIEDIKKGQLCIVVKQHGDGLIEVVTINDKGHVFVVISESWQFNHYREQRLELVG